MGKVKIVTDSTADIPKELVEELDITVVPLKVHFGDDMFEDGINLTPEEFYNKLDESNLMPSTSQPTPFQFEEEYKRLAGNDEDVSILSIHLSSRLSGTYQSAHIASLELENDVDITVIDSKKASYAIGIMVTEVARLAKEGADKRACERRMNELLHDTSVFFMVDTLEYLEKNGRIGKASAMLGSLLKIKPILSLNDDGEVFPYEKARGQKKALGKIYKELETRFGTDQVYVGISHAKAYEEAAVIMKELEDRLNVTSSVMTSIGPVIGAHVGPGTISISVTKS
ncbi:DegV family protein [Alteribacter aurantiacus]|uniref:DegV family protein n=1 Tax=Alteribacter aurantiacus TaxID=254410 RepID=UPI000417AF6A|nr:DegV family protein [Alteribacter aurantiacus]